MKTIYIALLVLISCLSSSESFAQGWCFHRRVENYVYVPYAPVNGYSYNSYYYQQPLVPVVVQNYHWVPVVQNRVEYRPVITPYFMNYSHYYNRPLYYNQNNYNYHTWNNYNY